MVEIKDLLQRFSNLLLSEEIKKSCVKDVISQIIGAPIDIKDVKIKNNSVYLNIKPIYKNEILLKQDQIFIELQNCLGKKSPEAVR